MNAGHPPNGRSVPRQIRSAEPFVQWRLLPMPSTSERRERYQGARIRTAERTALVQTPAESDSVVERATTANHATLLP